MVDTADRPSIDYERLAARLEAAPDHDLFQLVVEAPFDNKLLMAFLFVGFICLYTVDEKNSKIQFQTASGTEEYSLAVERYNFTPASFHLHFEQDKDNTIVEAIATGKPKGTTDWVTLSRRNKSDDAVRFNQANSGIAYTAIYPFPGSKRGGLMYNFYQYVEDITDEQRDFMEKYTAVAANALSK